MKSNIITISDKITKYIILAGICVFLLFISYLGSQRDNPPIYITIALIVCAFISITGLGIVIFKIVKGRPQLFFSQENIVIKLSSGYKITIPWGDIEVIGTQTIGVPVGSISLDADYLTIKFKDPSKYGIHLSSSDKSLFSPHSAFANFKGDFVGDLYVDLSQNLNEKEITSLPEQFKQKLSIDLPKLSSISKIP